MHQPYLKQKAFITGSSRGIGKSIALELARLGADILIHYRREESEAQSTAEEIRKLGREAWIVKADLTDTAQTESMLDAIARDHESLDIFVANAASTSFKPLLDLKLANVDLTFSLVIKSFLLSVQKLRPLLAKKQGRILTISGIDTVQFCPGHGLLAAAKAALETLTHYLAVELSGDGIRALCLNPGLVKSDSTKFYLGSAFDDICKSADATAPHGGFASTEDVAKIAANLLSADWKWLAAKTVHVDGGLSWMLPTLALKS